MKITLCMIVKNESKNLLNCLESVKNYVDEIVVVDTGSTDNTKKIALKYTDKVYDFKWCDDFAKPRNYSISKATNDWILVIDADEQIEKFDKNSLFAFDDEKIVGRINIKNLVEDKSSNKNSNERVSRFLNRKYYHYEGIIHEQLCPKGCEYKFKNIDISVKHIGYIREEIERTNKIHRNIVLIQKLLYINKNDTYLHYQLGKSYYLDRKYEEACNSFKKALKCKVDFSLEYTEDLIETLGYSFIRANKYYEALNIKEFASYYNNSPDYNFLMGLIYMNNSQFDLAVKTFLKCIGKEKGKIEGINSYLPNYNIGVIFECLGCREEAYSYYSKCMDYKPAVDRVTNIRQNS